jgi:hypothetical protein
VQLLDKDELAIIPRKRNASMMPFGKYRGAPLDAVLDDVPYVEWLLAQNWFSERYSQQWQFLADYMARTRDDADGPGAA